MSSTSSEENNSQSHDLQTIDLQKVPSGVHTAPSECESVEESIMSWFCAKGIKQANPQDLILMHHQSLRECVRNKARKLSAPDEGSMLRSRRLKGNMSICL